LGEERLRGLLLGGLAGESSAYHTSTTATADQALAGRFWNGAIQNYWNEILKSGAHPDPIAAVTTAANSHVKVGEAGQVQTGFFV
jgi:hypothetical protein